MSAQRASGRDRDAPSQAMEDYAKAIYALEQHAEGPVTTSRIAERLGVSPSSVTAMLKRLSEQGVVDYEAFRGATLTPAGQRVALEVLRHHRLLETYLSEALGVPWDRIHAEAEVLEHHISEELETRIAAALGDPERDPHGDPIPRPDLSVADERGAPLTSLEPGQRSTVTRVSDSRPDMLRYLEARGIVPGARVRLVARDPFGGGIQVSVAGTTHTLGEDLGRRVLTLPA